GLEQLEELHRPWVDEVLVSCEHCGAEGLRRLPDVGDAWLDAGIVPFSTLGWQNPEWKPGGYATGASKGLSGADLPDHAQWEKWFPADWVTEMREQIRLWFYSQLFMSVALVGRAPYRQVLTFEKLNDEAGRAMHKSWGNAIELNEALEKMGADVMRWLYASQIPSQNLNFGYGPAGEVKRRLLTFWNTVSFLVTYANIEGFEPRWDDLERGPEADDLRPLDRWVLARTQELVAEATDAYESFWTPRVVGAFEGFVDDLSNWYVRRNRRRFWDGEETAFRVLWYAVVQALRLVSPIMPFLAEHLWGNLVARPYAGAPESVFLAGWPREVAALRDEALLAEVAEARRVVELGRAARSQAGVKLRQPLRRLVVEGVSAAARHAAEIGDELRVKDVAFGIVEGTTMRAKPNLVLLGPKLGSALPEVRAALAEGRFEQLPGGRIGVLGHELGPEEVFIERTAPDGWELAEDGGLVVALDTRLDAELELEGRVLDLIHTIQRLRKDSGLEITDRIVVTLPEDGGL
ncbi:MAG TPA: class I tRNA ligase family protein, partial [Gaiellaceae bacterium]|nr:class I tRNA ligase family protein [Gaiellaceae bacterium]